MEQTGEGSRTEPSSPEVSYVEDVDSVWPEIVPYIERGLRHGAGDSITSAYLRDSVANGRMTLWVVHEDRDIVACVILEAIRNPGNLVLRVVIAAGRDFHRWVYRVQDLIRDMSEIIGADCVEAVARKGMAKWLSETGWREKATIMELPNGR